MPTPAEIEIAFNRTTAHPADARVRLASSMDDLAALNHADVTAVIWEREMPGEIMDRLRRPCHPLANVTDVISARIFFMDESRLLKEAFKAAVGKASTENRTLNAPYNQDSYERLFLKAGQMEVIAPHVDRNFTARLACVYSPDETYGTEWYPGKDIVQLVISQQNEHLNGFWHDMEDIRHLKPRLDPQVVRPGSVLLLKGTTNEKGDPLPHSAPFPKAGVPRVGMLIGA